MKKITSLILCIVLTVAALTALSVAVFADEGETPAVSDVTLDGYQNKNGGFDIRIVGKIANEANYREVGFVFSNGTTSKECAAKYMFKTLLASDGENTYTEKTAGDGEYLFAYIIEGIEKSAALTFSVKPYAVNQDNEKIYGEEKTLVKKADEQFAQETVHTHTPIHHEATASTYATEGNLEYWACMGCSKLFSDATCETETTKAEITLTAQKDVENFENTEATPYLLANAVDYEAYAAAVNGGDNMSGKYAKLTADIGTEEAPVTTAIGTSNSKNYYAGNFDGNGKTVWVNISVNHAAGAIAYLAGGSVKSLTVRGNVTRANAATKKAPSYVGGIVGLITSAGGTVTDCTNYATVTGPDYCSVGGIVGHNTGVATIENCANYGEIKGGNLDSSNIGIGGIIGRIDQDDTRIENCINNGAVSSTGSAATTAGTGGIVGISGMSRAVIDGCINNGTVSGYRFIGGVIGRVIQNATITNVSNTAAVSGTRDIGGIIGGTDNTNTSSTFNELYVTGATNSGAVTGTGDFIGGIVGYIHSKGNVLTNCTNTGNITGVKCVGGIIGLVNGSKKATVDNATVRDCTISGTQSVGGWIGRIVDKATATYKNYTAPTGVTYKLNDVEMTATAGFDTTNRTTGAETTTPGEAFGTCAGTATNVTE